MRHGTHRKSHPRLLHDARLTACHWDRHLRTLDLSFQCLRRNADGTPLDDPTVDLKLGGVGRIVAYYSPARIVVKPSEFEPGPRITLADLEDWPHTGGEAQLAINSPQADFDAETACVRDTLVGDAGEAELRVHLTFEPRNYGPQGVAAALLVECDSLEPSAGGIPLDIETWERQFEAWWAGWRDHWAAKDGAGSGDEEPAYEDTFIPAGPPDAPDLSYRPPAAAPFLVAAAGPADLLKPIEDYHTGFHGRDWPRVAAAYPHFDLTTAERADRLRAQYLGWDHGRWVYVRRVDGWWREGNRACVVVRGIEHAKGDAGEAGRNEETVITYGLRKYRGRWVIATWSQGWPRFGSAAKLPEPQPWRDGWNLAE